MVTIPVYVKTVFVITTLLTIFIFYKARPSLQSLMVVALWCVCQSIVTLAGFYTNTSTVPPRFLFLIGPPVVLMGVLFLIPPGKKYLDSLNLKILTLLHVVRVPVEIVLYWLFVDKAIPELMTFEGRNFDIISGLTAPLIYYFGFVRKNLSGNIILVWNFICLGLLINIVVNAILSAPTPFQRFAFEQPNIGILYFPFSLLPGCIVPLVLLSHLAAIKQLVTRTSASSGLERARQMR
jgi:hypothetical protein